MRAGIGERIGHMSGSYTFIAVLHLHSPKESQATPKTSSALSLIDTNLSPLAIPASKMP